MFLYPYNHRKDYAKSNNNNKMPKTIAKVINLK